MMAKNVPWCLLKTIIQKTNLMQVRYIIPADQHFKQTHENDDFSVQNPINIDYREVKSYKQFLNESRASSHSAIAALMESLDVTKENATDTVNSWKSFGSLTMATIMTNDTVLRNAGANKSTLRQNMFALGDTSSNIRKKIKILHFVELDINSAIPLFQLSVSQFSNLAIITKQDRGRLVNHANRISYLSDQLSQDIYKLCFCLCHASHMFKISITKLIQVTEFLLGIGIPGERIAKDFVVYQYCLKTIKARFAYIKQAGLTEFKPWMVRCPQDVIESMAIRLRTRENLMPPNVTLVSYISQELNCDPDAAQALIQRDPTIKSINAKKLSEILKTLRDCGYTIEHIYRTPRSLHASAATLNRRCDTWLQYNAHKPPLHILASSEKIFDSRLNDELKNKK